MALFVLMVVGLVVAQTWFDWRDAKRDWVVPEWAKGMALAGAVAASLTAATSFASSWLQDSAAQSGSVFNARLFWPELGFLLCAMAVIVVAVRKKRLRLMLILTGILTAAFWIGMTIS
jgi:lipopolysaccharide export LptBFGC system permease protein LptF